MNMKHIGASLLLMGLVGSAAAAPIDRSVLYALSPVAYQVIRDVEVERGKPFETLEEVAAAMATDDFQARMQSSLRSFCSQPENGRNLACTQQTEINKH